MLKAKQTSSLLSERELFQVLVSHDQIKKADAIILLEGDGFARLPEAIRLYKEKWAPMIVISGGINDPSYGSLPLRQKAADFQKAGILAKNLLWEENSQNTHEQAEEVIKLCQSHKWQKIILVASPYHQYRAFLTFLRVINQHKLSLLIMNAPCQNLSWFETLPWGRRIDLLQTEFQKITTYQQKGDAASFAEALTYLEWQATQA